MADPRTEEPVLQSIKRVLLAFSGAYKKLNLYSPGHSVYQDAVSFFKTLLNESIDRYGNVRLDIERDRILYCGETAYKSSGEPTDPTFILHRDGILSIEFQTELELWEIDAFLKVLHHNCVLEEDAEDDIATALWVLNLPSIHYEAADLELGLAEDLDFENLRCRPPEENEPVDATDDSKFEEPEPMATVDKMQPSKSPDNFFQLSPNERKQLETMVAVEEELDGSDYVVDVLFYIIENHALTDDINDLLNHLTRAMHEAMLQLRFSYLHLLMGKIKNRINTLHATKHWSLPHLERFYAELSSQSFLNQLASLSYQIEHLNTEAMKSFKEFLSLLDASAIPALAPIMLQIKGEKTQRILLETIARMAIRDLKPLENVLFAEDKELAGTLVQVLKFLKDKRSQQVLFRLLHDESEILRRQALKALIARKDRNVEKMFVLIGDQDKTIQRLLLKHLGKERSVTSETLLLEYLKSGKARGMDPDHYLEVCLALGRCASDRSMPFLKSLLFRWPRLGIMRSNKSILHRGAIIALKELNTQEAADLIERSGRGFGKNFLRPA